MSYIYSNLLAICLVLSTFTLTSCGSSGSDPGEESTDTSSSKFIWPVHDPVLEGADLNLYSAHDVIDNKKYHTGYDLTSHTGSTTIYAAASGRVRTVSKETYANDNHYMGNVIIIDHNDGKGPFTLYAHLASFDVINDVLVDTGDPIGEMGNTGCSLLPKPCGTHLHFEVNNWGLLGNLDDDLGPNWGYTPGLPNDYGYLNPLPYINNGLNQISPTVVKSNAMQNVFDGPGNQYSIIPGNIDINQSAVATQRVGDWFEVNFPSEHGPKSGWIQATPSAESHVQIYDPERGTTGVSVRQSPDSTSTEMSHVWDQQYIPALERASAGNDGCSKAWVKTPLLDGDLGWVCGEFILDEPIVSNGSWFDGHWEGRQGYIGSVSDWSVSVDLDSTNSQYLISYPSLGCSGIWQFVDANEQEANFIEDLTGDDTGCITTGEVTLSYTNDNEIEYYWGTGGIIRAQGTLYR